MKHLLLICGDEAIGSAPTGAERRYLERRLAETRGESSGRVSG